MLRLLSGWGLLGIALFMLIGFLNRTPSDHKLVVTVIAFGIAVILPAIGGIALIWSHYRKRGALTQRKEHLRQQTLEAEVIQLATRKGGKLTIVEVVGELAIDVDTAKQSLESLAEKGVAQTELTTAGTIVYAFYDIQNLDDKSSSKGVLDV